MRIGNVDIKTNVALGPMAGVTDLPFRLLCKEQGCGLLYTEMVSAKAIYYNNKNTDSLMEIHPDEVPASCSCSVLIRRSLRKWQNVSRSVLFPFWI
jgi:tRNA-dihydrouridine synthase B